MSNPPQNLTPLTRVLRQAAKEVESDLGQQYLLLAGELDSLIQQTRERGNLQLVERITATLGNAELDLARHLDDLSAQIADIRDVGKDTHQLAAGIHEDQRQFMGDTLQRFNTLEATFCSAIDELRQGQREIRTAHEELNDRHGRQLDGLRQSIDDLRHNGTELSQANAQAIERLVSTVMNLQNQVLELQKAR